MISYAKDDTHKSSLRLPFGLHPLKSTSSVNPFDSKVVESMYVESMYDVKSLTAFCVLFVRRGVSLKTCGFLYPLGLTPRIQVDLKLARHDVGRRQWPSNTAFPRHSGNSQLGSSNGLPEGKRASWASVSLLKNQLARRNALGGAASPNAILEQKEGEPTVEPQDAAFLDFVPKLGINVAKVGLGRFDGVRGVVAVEQLHPNDLIITVPFESTITTTEEEGNPLDNVNDEFWAQAKWDTRLALKLLTERMKSGYDAGNRSWPLERVATAACKTHAHTATHKAFRETITFEKNK